MGSKGMMGWGMYMHYVYVQVSAFKKMCRRMVMIEGEGEHS